MYARVLHTEDLPQLDGFLSARADSSMILRGNLLSDGVEDTGTRHAGVYAGAFDASGALCGVVAHYRRFGNVFPQADREEALDAALACALEASGGAVRGIIGLRALVRRARTRLGLDGAPCGYDVDEGLYALDLDRLRTPLLLLDGSVELRPLRASDASFYLDWLIDYEVDTLGREPSAARASSEETFERRLASGEPCLLTHGGTPSATSDFNARLPDMVQVGGVYTPPALRGRGYARAAVALSLVAARRRGVRRAVLFTGEHNVQAIAAYRALGFQRVGDFALVLFR